jgi:Zn-dependent protease
VVVSAFPARDPGYNFLSDANASLRPQVALLDKGNFREVRQQLERDTTTVGASRDWTLDCILAIAASKDRIVPDTKAALDYFYTAAAKHPDQAEFYYYYGLTLLRDGQLERAGEQFNNALKLEPKLEIAQKYLTLVTSAYYPPEIITALLFFIILLVSFTVHEYGHAYSAWKLGDDTAKNLGRLTLNPIAHLDLFGSILLPGIMLLQQTGMVFGWAKPVPVDPRNFKNPRKDHMIVSFAGPATNLMIAMTCFIILGFLMLFVRLFWPETIALDLATPYEAVSIVGPPFAKALVVIIIFVKQIFYTSLVLGCLNLLPFPPLDSSWILAGLLPGRLGIFFEKIRGFGSIIFLILVVTPVLGYLLSVPLGAAWLAFKLLFSAIGVG